jgi:hypothetical protein
LNNGVDLLIEHGIQDVEYNLLLFFLAGDGLLLGFVLAGVHRKRCLEGGGAVICRAFATATSLA